MIRQIVGYKYPVFKVRDGIVNDLQDTVQPVNGHVSPPLPEYRLVNILQHPRKTYQ